MKFLKLKVLNNIVADLHPLIGGVVMVIMSEMNGKMKRKRSLLPLHVKFSCA